QVRIASPSRRAAAKTYEQPSVAAGHPCTGAGHSLFLLTPPPGPLPVEGRGGILPVSCWKASTRLRPFAAVPPLVTDHRARSRSIIPVCRRPLPPSPHP